METEEYNPWLNEDGGGEEEEQAGCPTCREFAGFINNGLRRKLEELESEVYELEQAIEWRDERIRRLEDDNREVPCPAPGVWLVDYKPGCKRSSWIAKLGEVPRPMALASVALHADAIANAVYKAWNEYHAKGSQCPLDVANLIVRELYAAGEREGRYA